MWNSSEVRDAINLDVELFFVTWEVGRWEWIFHFVDIGLKLINFELKKDNVYIS